MSRYTFLLVAMVALIPVVAGAQFGAPAGGGQPAARDLPPCMIVAGHALTPAAFIAGMAGLQNSPKVTVDGVEMALVGVGARSAGGRASLVRQGGDKILQISMAGQSYEFLVLAPSAFWLRPQVRELIPRHRRQPIPDWPHKDCNFPSRPPFAVNWKRPYLDWKPDESWLAMMLAPPVVEEPKQPEPRPAAPTTAPAPAATPPSTPAPGPPPGMMGAPAPGGAPPADAGGAPPPA